MNIHSVRYLSLYEERLSHYMKHLGPLNCTSSQASSTPYHIGIHFFGPSEGRPYMTMVTNGAADIPQPGREALKLPARTEIMAYCHQRKDWIIDMIMEVAEFPYNHDSFLADRLIIDYREQLAPEPSAFTSVLLSTPHEIGKFDRMPQDGEPVQILLATPITTSELKYAKRNGNGALISLFSERYLSPVIDENRQCIFARK